MSKKLEWTNAKRKLSELIPWSRNPRKIGAEQTKRLNTSRRCYAIEISPGYVGVALQRWADATGKTPVLLE